MAPIKLYTAGTPNGHKINIALEELGLEYEVHKIDIAKNVQKEPWFLEINPNGRIPAIVDGTQRIFEGGAILQYLTARYDPAHRLSFAPDSPDYWESLSWLTWMQSGLGPMQGQANHFYRYAPEKIPYAVDRYQTETRRLYRVLEERLVAEAEKKTKTTTPTTTTTTTVEEGGPWLVGGRYSIADLACFSWVEWHRWAGVELDAFPAVGRWKAAIEERPATEKGLNVPDAFELREAMKTNAGEEEYTKHHASWVMQGQRDDQEKHK